MLSIDIGRTELLLGEAPQVELRFDAERDEEAAPLFDHPSLTLELEHPGAIDPGWPWRWFPNCWAVERHLPDGGCALDRCSTGAPRRAVRAGESFSRRLDAAEGGLAIPLLDVGEFRLTYYLTTGAGEEVRAAAPAAFRIVSGPAAVPKLIDLLGSENFGLRRRAAWLLRRMTWIEPGFDPWAEPPSQAAAIDAWRAFWRDVGSRLRWRFDASGATFEAAPPPADPGAAARTGPQLGGLVYRRASFDPRARWELIAALKKWLDQPTRRPLRFLQGSVAVADHAGWSSPADAVNASDPVIAELLARAIRRITAEIQDWPERAADAVKVIETLKRVPMPDLLLALRELNRSLPAGGVADAARRALGELLDFLDPERVPA